MGYYYSDVKGNVQIFYEMQQKLMPTDIYYSTYAITQESKEHFVVMLYSLVKAMNSVYKKASYYGFNNITDTLLKSIYSILDAMEEHIKNRPNMRDNDYIIDKMLSSAREENKSKIINYLNIFDEEV